VAQQRGCPTKPRCDNGPELVGSLSPVEYLAANQCVENSSYAWRLPGDAYT
jgi:hypothetical protein